MRMTTETQHDVLSGPQKLVKMANQMGDFFKSYPEDTGVEGIRDHISKFWNKKMREELLAFIDSTPDTGLTPLVAKAVSKLRA
jgi:formate dehydrogenase subunit delta